MRISDWSSDACSSDLLARSGEANFLLESAADERVTNEGQTLAQRHADAVRKFDRCRARAALCAVDDDIIETDAGLDHRLHDGIDFVRLPDAKENVRASCRGRMGLYV